MRRGGTALVVVVVAAIALAAGFDALRGEPEPEPAAQTQTASEPPTTSTSPAPESPPPATQLGGVLYYTDESCELQAARLPDLTPVEAPNWDECRFVLSPDGRRVSGAGSGWDPHTDPRRGRLFQSDGRTIQVSTNGGPEGEPFEGTAPAWRPDGTLTYFADGALREWPNGDVVLSQRALLRAARTVPFQSPLQALSLREAAWLDERRLAAITSTSFSGSSGRDLLAIYDGRRLATWRLYEPGEISGLRVSPRGSFVAATYGRDQLDMLDASGESLDTPDLVGYRAITWSPDDRWAAVAADDGIVVFRPGATGPPELELALDARDLAWHGPDEPTVSDETREWLESLGLAGRLLVTQDEGRGCVLSALQIPGLDWAERPQGRPSPCRFAAADARIARMPDGSPTFATGGELFAGRPGGRSELLLSAAGLRGVFGRPAALEEVAWRDDERFWAVVRSGETATIALLSTDERVAISPSFTAREIEGLRVSATGMVAARSDQGVVIFDSGGRRALTFPDGRAVVWAPGELIAAVATANEIQLVAPLSREVVSIPLAVRDLEWVVP